MSFSDPKKNIEQFTLSTGWRVADFGAGPGEYVFLAAGRVGKEGRVYAIDVQKALLSKISEDAKTKRLSNIEVICGDVEEPEGSKLKEASMDAVIASNILFQAEDKKGIAREIYRVLKPLGKVLIVDWTDSFGGLGPKNDMVVSEDMARQLCEGEGFIYERSIDAGDHHYGIIFKKK